MAFGSRMGENYVSSSKTATTESDSGSSSGPQHQNTTSDDDDGRHNKISSSNNNQFRCQGTCGQSFPSRNAVFKHLKDTDGACLDAEERHDFWTYVRQTEKLQKVVLLYGYFPFPANCNNNNSAEETLYIRDGQDAGRILLDTISEWQHALDNEGHQDGSSQQQQQQPPPTNTTDRLNRSYGNSSKNCAECVRQDPDTSAISELLAVKLHRLRGGLSVEQWMEQIQTRLDAKYYRSETTIIPCPIRILGRQDMPLSSFNAERDASFRRMEYVLPLDFLAWSFSDNNGAVATSFRSRVLADLPVFAENHKHGIYHVAGQAPTLDPDQLRFMVDMKNIMKRLRTHVVSIDKKGKKDVEQEKKNGGRPSQGPQKSKSKRNDKKESSDESAPTPKSSIKKTKKNVSRRKQHPQKEHYLKRKRFHNFTETVMAHDFLAYRRLDRMYHRATLELPTFDQKDAATQQHKYIVLSLSGDLFLTGQVQRLVGVFLALMNGVVDADFVDCVFDEEYPHLIPTPPLPSRGVVAADAQYVNMEGKTKVILSPRMSSEYADGFNQKSTLLKVKSWQEDVYDHIAREWEAEGRDPINGRLNVEKTWTETILKPWAAKAQRQLEEYRRWKKGRLSENGPEEVPDLGDKSEQDNFKNDGIINDAICTFENTDGSVQEAYERVLRCLREVDASGNWPTTTPKRQLVMVSTSEGGELENRRPQNDTLSTALLKARLNTAERSSAYSFNEGQGGASGSFSVGYMPGGVNKAPKANALFPELVQAAFELERVVCPDREPSSTIAINRNAQFRPHTDSGAGAGQSTSLIVGLGTYTGGELMVEGEKHDIRYKAIEFNGWKQRHWTMPFVGERYSLVWFTPKGCEGMRGSDLKLPSIN